MNPLDISLIHDKIVEYVGPKYASQLRLVNHTWNTKALTMMGATGAEIGLTPQNIRDFCSSTLYPLAASLKIALDLGTAPEKVQFYDFIHTIRAKSLHHTVTVFKFQSTANSFRLEVQDCLTLAELLRRISPTLRHLHLFNRANKWNLAETGGFLPSNLMVHVMFPQLKNLVYCWQEATMLLFDELLRPEVLPQLVRLHLTAPTEDLERSLYNLTLVRALGNLAAAGIGLRLAELNLSVDVPTSGFLMSAPFQLPTVQFLILQILRRVTAIGESGNEIGGRVEILGDFIGRIFPNLITLDLKYDGSRATTDTFHFPSQIGNLPDLESLRYGIKGQQCPESEATLLQLEAMGSELMSNKFPALRYVVAHLGFELHNIERGPQSQLQFITVNRLELHIGCIGSHLHLETVKCATANLRGMYPFVSYLALDYGNLGSNARVSEVAKCVIQAFDSLEELELVNCSEDGTNVIQLFGSEPVVTGFSGLRRFTLEKASTNPHPRIPFTTSTSNLDHTKLSLTLADIIARCPQLEKMEADEQLLAVMGQYTVSHVYAEAYQLQSVRPGLKIKLN